jgi:hypothetical protein
MGVVSTTKADAQDPFAGFRAQPVRCCWLTKRDEEAAQTAEIIRLVMDDQRVYCDPSAKDVTHHRFFREVLEFIGPTNAVLVTPAGAIKACIPRVLPTLDSLRSGFAALEAKLMSVELGCQETLVGVDGYQCDRTTHLQTVVHLQGRPSVSLANATVKLYPTKDEKSALVGWRVCEALGRVPEELTVARRARTAAGMVLVLVCNDATPFSARSKTNLRNSLGRAIRDHFLEQALGEPSPAYILIATHWQGTNYKTGKWSGEAFRQAARYLNDLKKETGATVVTTLRASLQELAPAAERFCVVGPRKEMVATLLVGDALEG